MTATLDAATHNNGRFEEGDVEPLDSNLLLDQDEDQTVRPNGFHLERLVPAQTARTSPDELPTLHVSPPASPSAAFDYEHRPSSRHSSITHTEVTGGITDRSSRRRSIMDRNNRFSGFITNLIGRRDRDRDQEHLPHPLPGPTPSPSFPPREHLLRSLASTQRPSTPPPPLPPPSLQELGLSLSVLTSNLSPSHFATPPTNGTFLPPHYLLLCHSQGLDVLPLTRPPAPQPYALVRRVPFKSVVVMEERGVLVAIAGRRDGVRVYALDEVRKAVEWRMDVEVRREMDRMRREDAKRGGSGSVDKIFGSASASHKSQDGLPLPSSSIRKATLPISTSTVPQLIPKPKPPPFARRSTPPRQSSPPPEYEDPLSISRSRPRSTASGISVNQSISHRASISTIVGMPNNSRRRGSGVPDPRHRRGEEKSDVLTDTWAGSSDDEAISLVAAGSSGSAALDERTSSTTSAARHRAEVTQPNNTTYSSSPTTSPSPNPPALARARRPSNLDLSNSSVPQVSTPLPSPAPTLTTLRQTLSRSPQLLARAPTIMDVDQPSEGEGEADGEEATTPTGERISFAQALLESRLPDLPPPGTRQPQRPVFIRASHSVVTGDEDSVPSTSNDGRPHTGSSLDHRASITPKSVTRKSDRSKRRRWTLLDGMFNTSAGSPSDSPSEPMPDPAQRYPPSTVPVVPPRNPARPTVRSPSPSSLSRSHSIRSGQSSSASLPGRPSYENPATLPGLPVDTAQVTPSPRASTSSNRFLPRIISNALSTRRSEESGLSNHGRGTEAEGGRRIVGNSLYPQTAAPKLEYVKLPGTKGSVMIKAVETAKKSFLAILCGEGGEKVELFAGTYRTALALSRTFILPDSPRNLELQLQGDDLVEVFLVFSQNVFGLEPATVRVREVRIGRAERRAARRRAREARTSEGEQVDGDSPAPEEESGVTVNIGVALAPNPDTPLPNGVETLTSVRPEPVRRVTDSGDIPSSPAEPAVPTTSVTTPDDLIALAASQIGSYTTFQQLSFAPNFPLATLADECIIPPTYASIINHPDTRSNAGANGEAPRQEVPPPPGLPLPPLLPPSKWFYKDPKGVVQGPWKASLMQSWYKDGFLPLELPVRRDTETEYISLQDLRLRSVDPNHPFRPAPSPLAHTSPSSGVSQLSGPIQKVAEPLLHPISLLAQPRHYGPPALFFSSRGGHSTAIVDGRGRSVLKGRFFWSIDDEPDAHPVVNGKLGDIKRVEAFDVRDRAVIVALRQGGLEAIDVGDALLAPADESRSLVPDFQVPVGGISRRGTYVWRIGAPVSMPPVSSSREATNAALHLVRKKQSSTKSDFHSAGFDDVDGNLNEEVLFLGRDNDNVYFCERHAASFRILRLAPF